MPTFAPRLNWSAPSSGALDRANGGYLILEAVDILGNPLAWDGLKRALKSRSVRIEDPLHEWRLAMEAGLQPEPIPLSTKVVLIGSPSSTTSCARSTRTCRTLQGEGGVRGLAAADRGI